MKKLAQYFQNIAEKLAFRKWYFAHYHEDADFTACGKGFGGRDAYKCFSCVYQQVLTAAAANIKIPEQADFKPISGALVSMVPRP